MSISSKFSDFCQNILISQSNIDLISNRYKRITNRLNEEYYNYSSETLHSLYVGSYGRDTDIHVSDVDILFILPASEFSRFDNYSSSGQSALLKEVKSMVEKTYSTTKIRGDGQVVVIEFADGIVFELVPCFSDGDNFKYPDTNNGGTWKITMPKQEINEIRRSNNDDCNKNLKRLCRMVRAWKDNCNVNIGGLLIDTLCYNFLKSWSNRHQSYLYYDYMTRDFFKYASELSTTQEYWLAVGSNQHVYKKGPFISKAKEAYDHALIAISNENLGFEFTANSNWKKIYGTKFTG